MSCKTVSDRPLPRRLDRRAGRGSASNRSWTILGGLVLVLSQVGCMAGQGAPEDDLREVESAKINAITRGQLRDEPCIQADQDTLRNFVIYTAEALSLGDDSTVTGGHVGVRDPNATSEFQLRVGPAVTIDARRRTVAKATLLDEGSAVGTLQTTTLDQQPGATFVSRADFPATTPIPHVVIAPSVGSASDDVSLSAGQERSIPPGRYRDLILAEGSLLRLQAGIYNVRNVSLATRARLIAQGPVTLRVAELITTQDFTEIRPTRLAAFTAKDLQIRAAVGPQPDDAAAGISIGPSSVVRALVVAPNARITFANNVQFDGALIARRAEFGVQNAIDWEDGIPGEACQPYVCDPLPDDGDACTVVQSCTPERGPVLVNSPDGTICDDNGEEGACLAGVCTDICNEQTQVIEGDPRLEYMATPVPNPTPSGLWLVRYVSGCMKYNPLWWWSVNGSEDGEYAWFLVEADKRQILPGTFGFFNGPVGPDEQSKPGFPTFDECVAKNLELAAPQVIDHAGNDQMSIYLADHPYADNRHGLLGQNPTWSLTPFVCAGQ